MIGLNWHVGGPYGWGVFGLNLLVELVRVGRPAMPLLEPMVPDFGPLHAHLLAQVWIEQQQLARLAAANSGRQIKLKGLALHALLGDFQPIDTSPFTGSNNAGLIFFENTHFSPAGLDRARMFDCVIAGSAWNAELLRAKGLTNVQLARQGIDPTLFHIAPRAGLFPGRFVIFSGGKLEFRKGQDLVLVAFRRFHARHPDALLLAAWQNPFAHMGVNMAAGGHVAGDPQRTPNGLDITNWLLRNKVPSGSFIDCGLVNHWKLAPLLREADAAIFPNRCEGGTNLVAMEAMACGVPSIISSNTGHLDLLQNDSCVPLHRQRPVKATQGFPGTDGWGESDPDEIVEALEGLYTDRDQARRHGASGARMMADWSWSRQVEHLMQQLPAPWGR